MNYFTPHLPVLFPCQPSQAPRAVVVLLGLLLPVSSLLAQAGGLTVRKGQAELKKLQQEFQSSTGSRNTLRQRLLSFRVRYPGTPESVQAATLLRQLPGPLDQLDPQKIPELDRHDWQPRELVAVLGEHRGRQGGEVEAVAFTTDGKLAASGGGGLARLWDPISLRLKAHLFHNTRVTCIAFRPDGKQILVGGGSGVVRFWDITNPDKPKLAVTLRAGSGAVLAADYHPTGKAAIVGCSDNRVHLYDTGSKPKEQSIVQVHEKGVSAVAFSPDGRMLVTGSRDNSMRLWTLERGELKQQASLSAHAKSITCLAFTRSGRMLASSDAKGVIHLWSFPFSSRSRPRQSIPAVANAVYDLDFSTSGRTLAAACGDGSIRLWTIVPRVRARGTLKSHAGPVQAVAYAPDMLTLLSGGADWTVRSWDLRKRTPEDRFQPWSHLSHVYSIAFGPDDNALLSGSLDTITRLWDLTSNPLRTRHYLRDVAAPVYAVAYSPDGKYLAAGGRHRIVHQWDARTGRPEKPLPGHPSYVYAMQYGPRSQRLLCQGRNELTCWDALRGSVLHQMDSPEERINCMALSPDGKRAVSGGGYYLYKDGRLVRKGRDPVYTGCILRLWDLETGVEKTKIDSFTTPLYSLSFGPEGKRLYAGVYESTVRQWKLEGDKLEELPSWKGKNRRHYYVRRSVVSPDGKWVFTYGLDGSLIQWEQATGKRFRWWRLPENVTALAMGSDSRHLAVAFGTGVIYILRLETLAKK